MAGTGGIAELGGEGGTVPQGGAGAASGGQAMAGAGGVAGLGGQAGSAGNAGADGGTPLSCDAATYGGSGHTYAFCAHQLSWDAALADCALHLMRFVRIDSSDEDTWVWNSLSSLSAWQTQQVWYGASDATQNGNWSWSDGELFWSGGAAVGGLYTNWSPGRPNTSSLTKNCLSVKLGTGKEWFDLSCATPAFYVCEQY